MTLSIDNNIIARNQFIGKDSTFFYINGGIASVSDNQITYNGGLGSDIQSAVASEHKRTYSRAEFPWEDYSFSNS